MAMSNLIIKIIVCVIAFLVAYFAVRIVNKALSSKMIKGNLGVALLRSFLTAVIWAAAVFVMMGQIPGFNQVWTTVLTSASVAGVVLGLAAQETLGNLFAGIALSVGNSKPFQIGDRVKIGSYDQGNVEDVTLRHIELVTVFNEHIFIPNSVAAKSEVINFSKANDYSQPMEISVAYEADLAKAMEIMAEVIENHPKYVGKKPATVLCKEAGESGVTLRGIVTTSLVADNVPVRSECLIELMKRYQKEGIEIPYNKLAIVQNAVSMNHV